MSRPFLLHLLVMLGVIGTAFTCAALGEFAYWWFAGEEGFAETLQVGFFGGALVYALRARSALARAGEPRLARLMVMAAVGLAFLLGEEVSWGQRIFGWSTPEGIASLNRQGETTLHNLDGLHQSMGWAQLLAGAWGALLPWPVHRAPASRLWRTIVPAVRFVPYFVPLLGWRIYRAGFSLPENHAHAITQLNEVFELGLAIGVCLMIRDIGRRGRDGGL